MPEPVKIDAKSILAANAQRIDAVLSDILEHQEQIPDSLAGPMRYTLLGPGKRIRAGLTFCVCDMIAGQINKDAQAAAAAIEMVHTYSLIHDDLPAIDNDDFRRGRKSCHKQFDEPTAILTGDALLTLAFEVLACNTTSPAVALELTKTLSTCAGPAGMIAGQMADILAENKQGSKELLEYIHTNKTAKMFRAAALCGAVAAAAGEDEKNLIADFGLNLGLCFQIADDILDVSGSTAQLGKTAGKDAAAGKLTYPEMFGLQQSKKLAAQRAQKAVDLLAGFGPAADTLTAITENLINRTN